MRDAAVFGGTLHKDIETYVDLLPKAGYDVAHSGKGWGPGALSPGGRTSPPTGRKASLSAILSRGGNRPFCFWWGTSLGHREFQYRPDGRSLDTIEVPPYVPDTPGVRKDYAGYYQEVEAFDKEVGKVVELLDKAGLSKETMLVVTSDHGQPWPRGKGSLYDLGTRVPLIVRWPARVKAGRVVDDFVSFTDFAPTFLDAGSVKVPAEMTGKSLMKILESEKSGTIDPNRDNQYPKQKRADRLVAKLHVLSRYTYGRVFVYPQLPSCRTPGMEADTGRTDRRNYAETDGDRRDGKAQLQTVLRTSPRRRTL